MTKDDDVQLFYTCELFQLWSSMKRLIHVNKLSVLVLTPHLSSPVTWLRHSRTDSPTSSVGGGVREGSVRSSSCIVDVLRQILVVAFVEGSSQRGPKSWLHLHVLSQHCRATTTCIRVFRLCKVSWWNVLLFLGQEGERVRVPCINQVNSGEVPVLVV